MNLINEIRMKANKVYIELKSEIKNTDKGSNFTIIRNKIETLWNPDIDFVLKGPLGTNFDFVISDKLKVSLSFTLRSQLISFYLGNSE